MSKTGKKPPFPFKKIAVAIGFTPRTEAILAESRRLQQLFNATMLFIHIGPNNLQHEQYLKHLLHRFELDKDNNRVIWKQGDPVTEILAVCKETYKVRCLPRDLVRTLVNRGMQEIRRSGHEFMREPEFYQNMMEHARSLNSRYRGEIARLNNTGIKQAF